MSVILVDNAYFGHALRRAPRDGGANTSNEPRVTRNQHPGIKFSSCENYIKFL